MGVKQPDEHLGAVPQAAAEVMPLDPGCVPALSLWEPWASLVALGEKRIETRSYPTAYRGWLAICSTASHVADGLAAMSDRRISETLKKHGITAVSMPLGSAVCMARLARVERTEILLPTIASNEATFGNYASRRYGWVFDRMIPFEHPIPVKGKQRIWKWTPPHAVQVWIRENCL